MPMNEPTTVMTDYLLGPWQRGCGSLFRSLSLRIRLWALAFSALRPAAFLGGTWHGFLRCTAVEGDLLTVGVASFGMVAGSTLAPGSGRASPCSPPRQALLYGWTLHDEFI